MFFLICLSVLSASTFVKPAALSWASGNESRGISEQHNIERSKSDPPLRSHLPRGKGREKSLLLLTSFGFWGLLVGREAGALVEG